MHLQQISLDRVGRNGKRVSMTALETETGNAFLGFFGRFLFLGSQKRRLLSRF
jgi:hypothetical protein